MPKFLIADINGHVVNGFEGDESFAQAYITEQTPYCFVDTNNVDYIGYDVVLNTQTGAVISETERDNKLPIELQWSIFRSKRDKLLSDCDWTQVPDSPVDKVAWAAYRQELRELPSKTTDPAHPVWPNPPS
jgi:hypothetical protein